jgi:amino acid transporter
MSGLNNRITLSALTALLFCQVSGGPNGLEEIVQSSGALASLILILITPFIWAIPAALVTAEMSTAIPKEGGYYHWVKDTLGPKWGLLSALWMWIYSWFDCALYPIIFAEIVIHSSILAGWLPQEASSHMELRFLLCLVLIVPFTIINIIGVKKVGQWAIVLTTLICISFTFLILCGLFSFFSNPVPLVTVLLNDAVAPNFIDSLGAGLLIVMWNYLGWSGLSTITAEIDNPKKIFPKALLYSMVLIIALYFLSVFAGLQVYPDKTKWESGVWPTIGYHAGGNLLFIFLIITSIASAMSLFNAQALAASRIPYVLALDGYLPKWFAKLNPKSESPVRAICFCSVIYSLLCLKSFSELITLDVFLFSSTLLLQHISFVVFRLKDPDKERPFKVPGNFYVICTIAAAPIILAMVATLNEMRDPDQLSSVIISLSIIILTSLFAYFSRGRSPL